MSLSKPATFSFTPQYNVCIRCITNVNAFKQMRADTLCLRQTCLSETLEFTIQGNLCQAHFIE